MKRSGSGTSNYRRIQRRRYHGRRQNPVPLCSLHCRPHKICFYFFKTGSSQSHFPKDFTSKNNRAYGRPLVTEVNVRSKYSTYGSTSGSTSGSNSTSGSTSGPNIQRQVQIFNIRSKYSTSGSTSYQASISPKAGLGMPNFLISKDQLEYLSSLGFRWKEITIRLGVSRMTVYRYV